MFSDTYSYWLIYATYIKVPFNSSVFTVIIACEIVQESFDNINQTECSTVKITLFCFNANYMQSTYVNIKLSTVNK